MEAVQPKGSNDQGEVVEENIVGHDAVFGELTEGGPNYRSVSYLESQNRR